MDYADLREEGIRQLETMAGGTWTDFNAHDPGITILEQVAYALSDLIYRIGYDVPDLLASSGTDAQDTLYPPEQILPCEPVTSTDLRKLVLDVPGVNNVWIEPSTDENLELHYHRPLRELSLQAESPVSEPVTPVGLFSVLIDAVDPTLDSATLLTAKVARTLYAHRPLCEDFTEIRVLPPEWIKIDATVEIDPLGDPDVVLLDVLERISDQIAPPTRFLDFQEATRFGLSIDEIFEGPRLRHGYLDSESLGTTARPTALRTSDIVRTVMDVPGVRAITRITLAAGGGEPHPWSVDLDPASNPQFSPEESNIVLTRGGLKVASDVDGVKSQYGQRREDRAAGSSGSIGTATPPPPRLGRDRSVGNYYSLQHQFPALYGIAEMGLPRSADPTRRAQAKQLKAYLAFYDQVIANMFAQLAHVGDLFSSRSGSGRTYFSGEINDGGLGLEEILVDEPTEFAEWVASLTDASPEQKNSATSRRLRFLDHLLARFAEQLSDSGLDEHRLVEIREELLARYPRASSARGGAADDLMPPGHRNESGLAERVRLMLGIERDADDDFVLVEHILLRPIAGDKEQAVPLLTDSDYSDPFSLQVSFVFPTTDNDEFRQLVHHVVRSETPAHLVAHIHWMAPDDFRGGGNGDGFKPAHDAWRAHRRETLRAQYGLDLGEDR